MYYFKGVENPGESLGGCLTGSCDLESAASCICLCSLDEVRRLVCHNPAREKLWLRLEAFLARTRATEHFSHLNLVGSFVSSVARPREIEVYLQTRAPYGPAALAAMEPLIDLGLQEIYLRYRVRLRFWVEGTPPGLCGFRNAIVSHPARRALVRVPLT